MSLILNRDQLNNARRRLLDTKASQDIEKIGLMSSAFDQINALADYVSPLGRVGEGLGDDNPVVQAQQRQAPPEMPQASSAPAPVEMPSITRGEEPEMAPVRIDLTAPQPDEVETPPDVTVAPARTRATVVTPSGAPRAMPTTPPSNVQASAHVAPHLGLIAQVAQEEDVPFDVLAGLMEVEQSGATSVSPAGARGLMQVVPGQGYDLPGEDASDPLTSIRQGARAVKDKHRITGTWAEAGRAYFGYGVDAGGMRTDVYGQRYDEARERYRQPSPGPQPTTPMPAEEAAHAHADDYEVAFGFNQQYSNPFNASIPRHRGVDLVVRGAKDGGRGSPVRAFDGGTVVAVTRDPNGGNGLILQGDDGLYRRYFHFDSMDVEQGQRIEPGQVIGVLGASGTEGFPHVHFEVSRGINGDPMDQLIDPTPYMRPRRQSALPQGSSAQPLAMASGDESLTAGSSPPAASPPAPPAGSDAPSAAGSGDQPMWSPDGPAGWPTAFQMGAGRSGGGIMFRGPNVPRDPDAVPTEAPIMLPGDGGFAPEPPAIDPAEGGLRAPSSYTMTPVEEIQQASAPLGPSIPTTPAIQAVQSARAEPDELAPRTQPSLPRRVMDASIQAAEQLPGPVLGVPNPVPIVRGVLENTEPAAGVPRKLERMAQIREQAARDQGRSDFRAVIGDSAVDDPQWRAANPELAAEYDALGDDVAMNIGLGVVGDAGRFVRGGRFVNDAAPSLQGTAEALDAIGSGIGSGARALGEAASDLGTRVTEGFRANQGRVAAADAQMAQQGSTVAPGTFGITPGQPARRPTVEVLREQLETARQDVQAARQADDIAAEREAVDRMWALDSQLADAVNARIDLEPRIASDVGRRIETLPLDERTADDIAMRGREVVRPDDAADIGGPSSVLTNSINLNALPGISPGTPRRTAATRNVVRQYADRYIESGARDVVDTYESVTPTRLQEAERRAIQVATDLVAGERVPPDVRRRVADLLTRAVAEGEQMLDGSKVVATGIDGRAMDAFIAGEGFTNKFAGLDNIDDAVDATWDRVGRARINREQARQFTERELRADQMLLGEHNLNGRMYAHVTSGPPLIAEAKPAAWFIWDNDVPRVASVHHHYGLGSPHADIHASTPEGIKRALWGTDAVAGARRIETAPGGPLNVGWRGSSIQAGQRLIADTPWAVGPSGESRMRLLTQILAIPMSDRKSLGQMIRRGEITDPRQLASVLLRESSARRQPATEAAKAALGSRARNADLEERFRLGSAVNRTRNEALILDPNPARVRAIYLVGNGDAYLNEVLEKSGGVVNGTITRLDAARAAQARINEMTGRDVPIIFKDTSAVVDDAGQMGMASGSKMINDAVEILPDGTQRPLSAEEALAPGRGGIRDEYVRAGFTDIGATPGIASRAGTDALARINADLGSAIGSSTFGAATGAALPAETEEQRRQNALTGAGIGLVAGPAASRMIRRSGGALATPGFGPADSSGLGNVPPSRLSEPTLPGMEPPYRRPDLPTISDEPNPGAVRGEDARRGTLPGFENIDPLTDPAVPPAISTPVPSQPIGEAMTSVLRTLNEPPPKIKATSEKSMTRAQRLEAGQGEILTESPNIMRRVAENIADTVSPWINRLGIIRYAGMLSDTASQVANIVPSIAMQGVDVLATPIAAGLDIGRVGALRATGRQADRQVVMSELPARLRGMRAGSSVGLQAAAEVLRTGLRPEDAAKLEQRAGFGTNIPGIAPEGSRAAKTVDFLVEAPLRALAAADAVFRTTAQGGHLMAEATAAATRANGGKTPKPEQIREAAKDPKVLERVQYLARRTVLQEDRMVTDWYRQAMNYRPDDPIERVAADALRAGISVEIPFVRTPYNIVAQGMGLTPAGLLGVVQDVKQGKAARETEHRLARVALGTAVMGAAAADYAAGNLTGPYPTDPTERSTLPPGWRPWSRKFEVGGETYYVPLAYLGPLALPPVVAILAGEAHKKGATAFTPDWAGQVAAGVGKYAAQETFIDGIAGIAKLFDERTGEATQARHIEQIASQFSPHIIGGGALGREIQRVMGMPSRDPEGAIEALLATHPATANRIEPRQDVLGRPASLGLGGPAGTVIRAGVDNDSGVIRAFRRGNVSLPTSAPKSINDPSGGRPRVLTPSQRHRWRSVFGQSLRESWDSRGNPSDPKALEAAKGAARDAADATILGRR